MAVCDLLLREIHDTESGGSILDLISPSDTEAAIISDKRSTINWKYIPSGGCVKGFFLLSMPRKYAEETSYNGPFFDMLPNYLSTDYRTRLLRASGAIIAVWSVTHASILSEFDKSWNYTFPNIFSNAFTTYTG